MNRRLNTRLDLINPIRQSRIRTHVEENQLSQKNHENEVPLREFQLNDRVLMKNLTLGQSGYLEQLFRGQDEFHMLFNSHLAECFDDMLTICV